MRFYTKVRGEIKHVTPEELYLEEENKKLVKDAMDLFKGDQKKQADGIQERKRDFYLKKGWIKKPMLGGEYFLPASKQKN